MYRKKHSIYTGFGTSHSFRTGGFGMYPPQIRGTTVAFNIYIRKEKKSQNNDLNFHFKILEKEDEIKPKI